MSRKIALCIAIVVLIPIFFASCGHRTSDTKGKWWGEKQNRYVEDKEEEKSWEFERFDVDIHVHEDSSFTVRETQVVNFKGRFSWLARDLSTERAEGYSGHTSGPVQIHDIAVFDMNGKPYDSNFWNKE